MKSLILAFIIFASSITAGISQSDQSGQSVVLCESFDEFGTASGLFESWNIDYDGGYVYILYKQIYAITSSELYIQVDKKSAYTYEYISYNKLTLTPETGKNWVMYDYFFTEVGEYKFTVMMDGKVAATAYTEIFVIDADSFDLANEDTSMSTFYYEDSFVTFCEEVTDGKMIGEAESFPLGTTGSVTVTIYIANDKVFKTDLFYIDVFEDLGDDFIDYDSYNITIQPEWDYAFVKQTFTRKGTYIIDVYNADDIYVNTGEVVIY